jgi:hypothetical protein
MAHVLRDSMLGPPDGCRNQSTVYDASESVPDSGDFCHRSKPGSLESRAFFVLFVCAGRFQSHSECMARKQNEEPTKRTAAYRKLLQREDVTLKMVRRRTTFALVGWLAALALAGWLLAYFA